MPARAALLIAALAALAACQDRPPAKAPTPAAMPAARVETTLTLPGGDGRVHIVVMPTGIMESARCLVAVGPNGQAAVSCAPKDLDIAPLTPE